MLQSRMGEKRARDNNYDDLKFIPGLTLSQHPPALQKDLFMKKLKNVIASKSLHPTEFEGYTIRERFMKMGWEQLLNFSCDKIYKRVVIEWMSSLIRTGDELTGIVDGKSYTITPAIIRDHLGVDTRTDSPYIRFNKADLDEDNTTWVEACTTVFGGEENTKKVIRGYEKSMMTPLVQVLWGIGVWTFHPRLVKYYHREIYVHEIYLLHALFTGEYLYSFAHLMIDDIWDMYEHQHRRNVPHAYYISEILKRMGAVSEHEHAQVFLLENSLITRSSFADLNFLKSDTEYVIHDWVTLQRVTFPRKVREKRKLTQLDMVQMLNNLQNQQSQMLAMITNVQQQIESQALEAQERERRAEIRAHAIIWDIERQRHYYEQEQEKIHKAWNKAYGSDEFVFPQISHTSFHPPRARSRYYDPSHGDEIPQAFQDIFHDIYGTRH